MKSRFDPLFQAHEEEFRAEMRDRERERMPGRVESIEATVGRIETWLLEGHRLDDRADRIENRLSEIERQVYQCKERLRTISANSSLIGLCAAISTVALCKLTWWP